MRSRSLAAALAALAPLLAACGSTHRMARQPGLDVHTFTRDSVNTHVLVAGQAMVMIDPGYEQNAAALEGDLRDAGLDPAGVHTIVLTHAHADHAGAARHFQERFHARVVAGAGDRAMLAAGRNELLCPTGVLGEVRLADDQQGAYTPFRADVQVTEPLDLGALSGVAGKVIPLPGHTRGSLVVVAGEAVFVGDLFRGAVLGDGAATHLYMCDLAGNKRDVARLVNEIAPAARWFFAGHFGPVAREEVVKHFEVPAR